ncbi:hypothetical protein [Arachidicoccus terrestris]|uniref:hypothetical protein n=1 Tax=Arachidicoccus terrestris TaxID=2875539 RepID=UPI001CC50EED|nr:hypothetical protein [Arachidicoccus terrestris]UAY56245.1 hypothetical protein K9M52_04295 [Arachidicoccus terrestris]
MAKYTLSYSIEWFNGDLRIGTCGVDTNEPKETVEQEAFQSLIDMLSEDADFSDMEPFTLDGVKAISITIK